MPRVGLPSTAVMTSPDRTPAWSTGPPGSGATTCAQAAAAAAQGG